MFTIDGSISFSGNVKLATSNSIPRGNVEYTNTSFTAPATYSFTVPDGVTSISYVVVGPGAPGATYSYPGATGASAQRASGGSGGGLAYRSNVAVTPGTVITVIVGRRGYSETTWNGSTQVTSQFSTTPSNITVNGVITGADGGDQTSRGPTGTYTGGGAGGFQGGVTNIYSACAGGGGAGGYSGNGGNGRDSDGTGGSVGAGGGGAGGYDSAGVPTSGGQGGGGVGIYGAGSAGAAFSAGGSGGANGGFASGGAYGGGGGGIISNGFTAISTGAPGAVRIIWGRNRSFPNTSFIPAAGIEGIDVVLV